MEDHNGPDDEDVDEPLEPGYRFSDEKPSKRVRLEYHVFFLDSVSILA